MTSTRSRVTRSALCGAVLLMVGTWVAFSASGQGSDPERVDRWEYLIVAGGNGSLVPTGTPGERKQRIFRSEAAAVERSLDLLGEDGWELVSVAGSPNDPSFFLKRPARKR